MKTEVMICGRDCQPGGANCNNYCNHDKSKPMADYPPAATREIVLARAKDRAAKAIAEAEKACAEFAEAAKFQPLADDVTLRECLEVLQYATYHDGRYGQEHNYEKFQGPAQRLVKRNVFDLHELRYALQAHNVELTGSGQVHRPESSEQSEQSERG